MITKEDIVEIANLAKLSVSDKDTTELCPQIQRMVDFVNKVNEVDFESDNSENIIGLKSLFREDRVADSLCVCDVLKNTERSEDGFFVLEKRS